MLRITCSAIHPGWLHTHVPSWLSTGMPSKLLAVFAVCPWHVQLAQDTTCLTRSYTLPDGRVIKVQTSPIHGCMPSVRLLRHCLGFTYLRVLDRKKDICA